MLRLRGSAEFLARSSCASRRWSMCQPRTFAVLSHMWVGDPPSSGERPRVGVIMHGILGSKANWKTPAKQLLQRLGPRGWRFLLLTHRGHHESPSGEAPHTIKACAADVLDTLAAAGVEADAEELDLVVCGHSFGGKVALMLLKLREEAGAPLPRATWLLDSVPGMPAKLSPEEQRRQQSVCFVMQVTEVAAVKDYPSRTELVNSLTESHGLVRPLAQWVAQSVKGSDSGGVGLSYDMPVVRSIYNEYRDISLFDMIEAGGARVGVVLAGRNRDAWGQENLDRLDGLAKSGKIQLEVLEDSGHNVHVDDLPGLLNILEQSFIAAERNA